MTLRLYLISSLVVPLFLAGEITFTGTNAAASNAVSKSLQDNLVARAYGKSFYADRTEPLYTWREASSHCVKFGMKLATISNVKHWTSLSSAYDSNDFYRGYWTSGRDSQEMRQFNWNASNDAVTGEALPYKAYGTVAFLTCLGFSSEVSNQSYLFNYPCSYKLGVLCETEFPEPKLVGSVDGKLFYAMQTSRGYNWTEASEYCKSFEMELCSITTSNQWQLLASSFKSSVFANRYWTSGRDSLEMRQFSWDLSKTEVAGDYLSYKQINFTDSLTCLGLDSKANNQSHLFHYQCSYRMGALCEEIL